MEGVKQQLFVNLDRPICLQPYPCPEKKEILVFSLTYLDLNFNNTLSNYLKILFNFRNNSIKIFHKVESPEHNKMWVQTFPSQPL